MIAAIPHPTAIPILAPAPKADGLAFEVGPAVEFVELVVGAEDEVVWINVDVVVEIVKGVEDMEETGDAVEVRETDDVEDAEEVGMVDEAEGVGTIDEVEEAEELEAVLASKMKPLEYISGT